MTRNELLVLGRKVANWPQDAESFTATLLVTIPLPAVAQSPREKSVLCLSILQHVYILLLKFENAWKMHGAQLGHFFFFCVRTVFKFSFKNYCST